MCAMIQTLCCLGVENHLQYFGHSHCLTLVEKQTCQQKAHAEADAERIGAQATTNSDPLAFLTCQNSPRGTAR